MLEEELKIAFSGMLSPPGDEGTHPRIESTHIAVSSQGITLSAVFWSSDHESLTYGTLPVEIISISTGMFQYPGGAHQHR